MAVRHDSEAGKMYSTLREVFKNSKMVYSDARPLLHARDLGLTDPSHIETIRRANLATFMVSLLGLQEISFYHLDAAFLDTFVAEGHQFLKIQSDIYLELKTQAYIAAISNEMRDRDQILDDLMPNDLERMFLTRRPNAKQPLPSEREFAQKVRNRRKILLDEPRTQDPGSASRILSEKYLWSDFLRDISSYVSKTLNVNSPESVRLLLGPLGHNTDFDGRRSVSFDHQIKQYLPTKAIYLIFKQPTTQTKLSKQPNTLSPASRGPATPKPSHKTTLQSPRPLPLKAPIPRPPVPSSPFTSKNHFTPTSPALNSQSTSPMVPARTHPGTSTSTTQTTSPTPRKQLQPPSSTSALAKPPPQNSIPWCGSPINRASLLNAGPGPSKKRMRSWPALTV